MASQEAKGNTSENTGKERSPNDQRSDSKNPNNPEHKDGVDNRSNQKNPNNPAHESSRAGDKTQAEESK
jgi:hypothetical protein